MALLRWSLKLNEPVDEGRVVQHAYDVARDIPATLP